MNYCELVVNVRLQHFYFIRNLFLNHSIKKKKKIPLKHSHTPHQTQVSIYIFTLKHMMFAHSFKP